MPKNSSDSITYRLAGLGAILLGHSIVPHPDGSPRQAIPESIGWTLASGVYSPRQLVEGFSPLLDTVVYRLGKDSPDARPARAMLLDNVASNLALGTRESTMPLPKNMSDVSRREVMQQADRIGKSLVQWAREHAGGTFDPNLNIRSPCEGHLLTPPNVDLMFGRRSQPHLMQLFNEYMHQMVLLRDSLLPFDNYQDVLIPVDNKRSRGIRHMETSRGQFLATLVTKSVSQASVMAFAKSLLAPHLPATSTGGYGFQYSHGVVLPALFGGNSDCLHLLQYMPLRLDSIKTDILFEYRHTDYYVADRAEIPTGTKAVDADLARFPKNSRERVVQTASLDVVSSSSPSAVRQLELRLEFHNGKCGAVDAGQIARGHRYAYHALRKDSGVHALKTAFVHSAVDMLLQPGDGLISASNGGVHVIPTTESVVSLALLGRLYPENVILLSAKGNLSQTNNAGKGFEPKFVIWGGTEKGEV
ncbi:conserved hypothetical protein [Uncinocarpus reesii 1704]|uniref:Uncharacterized protein n=1 Tax=Uncinocarpus reesii (strain UAMH 1704) TaxID=336963 RepID=C4JN77_UNCRE|nr:uncharacterized protein UREG_02961 [Uncinocarpus reesii 1704]EEP78116.1 conserved hypothetical protein [Uncinocarpus reesii 1704]